MISPDLFVNPDCIIFFGLLIGLFIGIERYFAMMEETWPEE